MSEVISRKQAQAMGLKRYFERPCLHGHLEGRFVSTNNCVRCHYDHHVRATPVQVQAANKRWRINHPGAASKATRSWQSRNKERGVAQAAKRRAYKGRATIAGYEKEIHKLYSERPDDHEVDHIVPLKHPLVCGLHVPWNLQYLSVKDNRTKGNRFDCDDPLQGGRATRR